MEPTEWRKTMKEFDKVIGYEPIKQQLIQIADVLKNHEIYAALGASSPRGLLLHGEPGVGKTLMAKCLIEASGRSVYTCRKAESNGKFVKTISNTFAEAAENAPSIVFLDDMDKFANDDERHRNSDEYVAVQTGIDEVKGEEVFVLATANDLDNLPHSLLRAGRFDRTIEVEAPRGNDAVKIIERYLQGKNLAEDLDPSLLARILVGRSSAALETVANEAGLLAGYRRDRQVGMNHLIEACLQSVFNVPGDYVNDSRAVRLDGMGTESQVIWHEAGHTVVSELLLPGSVALVTARRNADAGGTSGLTVHDTKSGNNLNDARWDMLISLAGRAAIEIKLGTLDTGTSSDLDHAFRIASGLQRSVCQHGFFLHGAGGFSSSETLEYQRELAAAVIIEDAYRQVKEMLAANIGFLDAIAGALAEKPLLTAPEIAEIRESCQHSVTSALCHQHA